MNKKVFLLASICALGLGSWDVQAYNPQPVLINKCMEDNHIPAGANEIRNSRLYSVETDTWAVPTLDLNMMCYCLDSYLGLPFEYIETHPIFLNMRPVDWTINCKQLEFIDQHKWDIFCHEITVTYGLPIASGNIPIDY